MSHPDAIVEAFDRVVARDGARPLLMARRGVVSALDLETRARVVEQRLRAAPVAPGHPVGLLVPNGPWFLAALLACRRARHPVALLEHGMPGPEVGSVARGLGLAGIVQCDDGWEPDQRIPDVTPLPGGPMVVDGSASIIKLTSGTGGRPRGVSTSSAALIADDEALRHAMGIGSEDRLVAMIPFSHSYGLSSLVIPCLTRGQTLVLPGLADPIGPLRAAHDFEANVLPTVPAWIAALLRLDTLPQPPRSLRLVLSAGAPLHPEQARSFRQRLGLAVHAFYGATECGGIAYDAGGTAAERGAVGQPLDGVELSFEAVDGMDPQVGGRLIVRSPALATGYVPIPDSDLGPAGFRTADLVTRQGGELRLASRLDAIINLKGHKVDPSEVEQVIAGLDAVEEVVVHVLPGTTPGQDNLCAVVSCPTGPLTADAVVAWCRERLAPFKVPRRVLLVRHLPRTARGKVDRGAVARLGAGAGLSHA